MMPRNLINFSRLNVVIEYRYKGGAGQLPMDRRLLARVVQRSAEGDVYGCDLIKFRCLNVMDARSIVLSSLKNLCSEIVIEYDPLLLRESESVRNLPEAKMA